MFAASLSVLAAWQLAAAGLMLGSHVTAFAPRPSLVVPASSTISPQPPQQYQHSGPYFFSSTALLAKKKTDNDETDSDIEAQVQKALSTSKRMSNLRNEKGVEYAPWMRISADEETKIRQLMQEKAVARKKRQEQERNVQGALLKDSQAQELSGTGLRYKIIKNKDQPAVELEWATAAEASTKGWIVKRRPAKTDKFEVIASYKTFGPLGTKGPSGGVYRYLDDNLPTAAGGYVYRVTECEQNGVENDLSQCLVEIQTDEEQKGALLAVAALGVVAVVAVLAGNILDPVQY